MKRRSLLKLFPSLGLALIAPKVAVGGEDQNDPDEEFLRDIHTKVCEQLRVGTGVDTKPSSSGISASTHATTKLSGDVFERNERDIGLFMHFWWGPRYAGQIGKQFSLCVMVNYHNGRYKVFTSVNDRGAKHLCLETREEVLPCVLRTIKLRRDEVALIHRAIEDSYKYQ